MQDKRNAYTHQNIGHTPAYRQSGGFGFYSSDSDYLYQDGYTDTSRKSLSNFGQTDYRAAFEDLHSLDHFDVGMTYDSAQMQEQAWEDTGRLRKQLMPFDATLPKSDGGHAQFASVHSALALAQRDVRQLPPNLRVMQDMLQIDRITEESEQIPEIDQMLPQVQQHRPLRARNKQHAMLAALGERVSGALVRQVKRSPRRALIAACATAGVLVCLLTLTALGVFDPAARYVHAKEVYLDGIAIGAVTDSDTMQSIIDGIYDDLSEEYGVQVLDSQLLVMREARVDPRYITAAEEVGDQIRKNLDAQVSASVIYIDGMTAVALASREDADWVLEQLQAPYVDAASEEGVGFVEDVTIEQGEVSYSMLHTKEDALTLVSMGVDVNDGSYTVRQGDTLESIAQAAGVSVADVQALNAGVTNETLSVGDELTVGTVQALINVGHKEIVTITEAIGFSTEYTTDSSLYVGQTRTTREGVNGEKVLTVEVRYINNQEVSRTVLTETVTREPVTRVVARGTAKLPTLVQGVSSYGFMTPCTGTLTSPFGPRWGSFHYGIDIANSYGTPIRASKAGTVVRAEYYGSYGYCVDIDHGNGELTRYGHCSSLLVSAGQYVAQGEVIALMGSTGVSTGNHCHFEIRLNGTAVNPSSYL